VIGGNITFKVRVKNCRPQRNVTRGFTVQYNRYLPVVWKPGAPAVAATPSILAIVLATAVAAASSAVTATAVSTTVTVLHVV
jgi:hypothetical protein